MKIRYFNNVNFASIAKMLALGARKFFAPRPRGRGMRLARLQYRSDPLQFSSMELPGTSERPGFTAARPSSQSVPPWMAER